MQEPLEPWGSLLFFVVTRLVVGIVFGLACWALYTLLMGVVR